MFAPGTCVQHHSIPLSSPTKPKKKGKEKTVVHQQPLATSLPQPIRSEKSAAEYERKINELETQLSNEKYRAEKLLKDLEIQLAGEKRKSEKLTRWLRESDDKWQGFIDEVVMDCSRVGELVRVKRRLLQ